MTAFPCPTAPVTAPDPLAEIDDAIEQARVDLAAALRLHALAGSDGGACSELAARVAREASRHLDDLIDQAVEIAIESGAAAA